MTLALQLPNEILHEFGTDGVDYIIRPYQWDLASAEKYLGEFIRCKLISDTVPKDLDGFLVSMVGSKTLWFEAVNSYTGENVGFFYLTDLIPSHTEKRFVSATFHAVVWDGKAHSRIGVGKAFIKRVFEMFRLHRLQAIIPLNRGGAIRNLKRLGFKDEGVLREAVAYNGDWFSVLILSILEGEV